MEWQDAKKVLGLFFCYFFAFFLTGCLVCRWKKQFKQLLEDTGYVTPGKHLSEVRVLFMGRECFEALSEHDCQQIYDNHQRELIENAKHNFQVSKTIFCWGWIALFLFILGVTFGARRPILPF